MGDARKIKDILIEKWEKVLEKAVLEENYELAAEVKKVLDNLKKNKTFKDISTKKKNN